MKNKWTRWLPILLMVAFALTRWPGLLPWNFSAFYALAFCGGVFLPRRLAWWLPLTTLAITDIFLNFYYGFWSPELLFNYVAAALIIWLGTRFNPRGPIWKTVAGGLLGAIIFYLITNTASWFFNPFHNPEYVKTFSGWLWALTKGTAGYPETWQFFRNTLLSGGLFAALFAGAMKLADMKEPAEETEEEPPPAAEPEKTEA